MGTPPRGRAGGCPPADAPASRPLASVIGGQYTGGKARWARLATKFPPMRASAGWPTLTMRLVLRALVNPRLALDLVRLTRSFRTRDWYRRPPFLPLPPRDYALLRVVAASGA